MYWRLSSWQLGGKRQVLSEFDKKTNPLVAIYEKFLYLCPVQIIMKTVSPSGTVKYISLVQINSK
jgi:hypothetical protein